MASLSKRVIKTTVLLSLTTCLIACIFHFDLSVILGLAFGSLIGLAGWFMIIKTVQNVVATVKDPKKTGSISYIIRYLFYALMLFLLSFAGINPIALLIGLMLHKAAVFLCGYFGKEESNEQRTRECS